MKLRMRSSHEQAPVIPSVDTDLPSESTISREDGLGLDDERRRRNWFIAAGSAALTALIIAGSVTLLDKEETNATTAPDQLTAAEQFANREDEEAAQETSEPTATIVDYGALLAELGPAPTYEATVEKASAPLAMSEIETVHDIAPAAVEVFDMWQSEGTQDMRLYYEFKEFEKRFDTPEGVANPLNAAIEAFLAEEHTNTTEENAPSYTIAEENARRYTEALFHIRIEDGYESSGIPGDIIDDMIAQNNETLGQWIRGQEKGETYVASFVDAESSNPDGMSTGMTPNTVISWTRESNAAEIGLESNEVTPSGTRMGVWTSYQSHDGKDKDGEFILPRSPYFDESAAGVMLIGTRTATDIEQTEQ